MVSLGGRRGEGTRQTSKRIENVSLFAEISKAVTNHGPETFSLFTSTLCRLPGPSQHSQRGVIDIQTFLASSPYKIINNGVRSSFLASFPSLIDPSNFTVDEIRGLMDKPTNIRNMSVIAHGWYLP
jgi:hypothetical protein